jgi:AraC-like DNA-binding protein
MRNSYQHIHDMNGPITCRIESLQIRLIEPTTILHDGSDKNTQRMQIAFEKLRNGKDPAAVIAEQSGYRTEASFRKAFKKQMGAGPGAVRRGKLTPSQDTDIEKKPVQPDQTQRPQRISFTGV